MLERREWEEHNWTTFMTSAAFYDFLFSYCLLFLIWGKREDMGLAYIDWVDYSLYHEELRILTTTLMLVDVSVLGFWVRTIYLLANAELKRNWARTDRISICRAIEMIFLFMEILFGSACMCSIEEKVSLHSSTGPVDVIRYTWFVDEYVDSLPKDISCLTVHGGEVPGRWGIDLSITKVSAIIVSKEHEHDINGKYRRSGVVYFRQIFQAHLRCLCKGGFTGGTPKLES